MAKFDSFTKILFVNKDKTYFYMNCFNALLKILFKYFKVLFSTLLVPSELPFLRLCRRVNSSSRFCLRILFAVSLAELKAFLQALPQAVNIMHMIKKSPLAGSKYPDSPRSADIKAICDCSCRPSKRLLN